MEDFSRYLGITRTLALICCIVYTSSQADGKRISHMAGSTVTLPCSNESINCLIQLAWTRNEENLFSFKPQRTSNRSCVTSNSSQKISESKLMPNPATASLKLNMSTLESKLYALIIENAQKTHTGNYTCETTTDAGVFEQNWELIITEEVEAGNPYNTHIAVAASLPCVCLLIFIIATLSILIGVCKRRSENTTQSARATSGGQSKHIYENSLELEGHRQCG